MRKNFSTLFISLLLLGFNSLAQTGWIPVANFGSNPGLLNMYSYVPANISGKAPLVIAMHGCGENAALYALQTGWDKLADEHGFYMVYPEQNLVNNSSGCFNWFVPQDEVRGQGEPLSIIQMVEYMKAHYEIDTTRIFVTGLSAGGCMTTVMLACYPDVFNAGAEMAGVPYKAATNFLQSDSILLGEITHTPQVWGDLVRAANPGYNGPWPRMAVFQGTADVVCNQQNATEVMKQWTNVHSANQTPIFVNTPFNSNPIVTQSIYEDSTGIPVVETFFVSNMPHGIALDTGTCYQQCGAAGPFAWEVYLSSSFWSGYFFGIMGNGAIQVTGLQTVVAGQANVTYSVPYVTGTTYHWTVPQGATIVTGQGSNQISVHFGVYSGNVSVTEGTGVCLVPADLFVDVTAVNDINVTEENAWQPRIFPNPTTGSFTFETNFIDLQKLQILNLSGQVVLERQVTGTQLMQTEGLPQGVYVLKAKCNGQSINQLLVISR